MQNPLVCKERMTADDKSLFCTLGSVTLLLASQRSERLEMPASLCVLVCLCAKAVYTTSDCMHVMFWQDVMRTHMFKTPVQYVKTLRAGCWKWITTTKLWCKRYTMQPVVGALALLNLYLLWPSIYLLTKTLSLSSLLSLFCSTLFFFLCAFYI